MPAALRCCALFCLAFCACASAPPPATRLPDPRSGFETAGAPAPRTPDADVLWQSANQVFERRCVVCHGCYDAPCQLKLESIRGAERGASPAQVYDTARLSAADPTRLGVDAQSVAEWRAKGFHSVLPDRALPDAERSVMLRMLTLKQQHPLTAATDLEASFTFQLDREQTCSDAEHFDGYAREHPLWGMPYALPGLDAKAHAALVDWLKAGAPAGKPVEPSPEIARAIRDWEDFFNEPSPKQKLASRYLYEHLFLGSLYFKGLDERAFFRLVRSRTPSGYAIDEIPTRRPFEDPGSGPFYYRLAPRIGTLLAKTHMPYALDAARLSRFRELFLQPDYAPGEFPSYELEVASNPLRSFAALPITSRYRFLLDEAEFFMMGFIKGPVCRGQVALNVIQERFWVTFVEPDAKLLSAEAEFLREYTNQLELPAEAGSNTGPLPWFGYSKQHRRFVQKKADFLQKELRASHPIGLDMIWDGDGGNSNAALTVFRHFDSATVVRGLVGGPPKTAWVVGYALLERIHYLLVAGYDVFGNVGHQLMTRMYMDFLRMEGESNFLLLVPNARRKQLADAWYQRTSEEVKQQVYEELASFQGEPRIAYASTTPERELYAKLEERLARVRSQRYALGGDSTSTQLKVLDGMRGKRASFMPELAFLAVMEPNGSAAYFTIARETALTNVAHLFNEDERRVPEADSLSVVPGFLGAYPNQLFRVGRGELPAFVEAVQKLDEAGYRALREKFGVSRKAEGFWQFSDAMYDAYRRGWPLEAGVFDYNRLAP